MSFTWKGLFTLALVNLFLVAVEVQIMRDAEMGSLSTNDLWLMAVINCRR